jgi:broad specificity phosphatase PhoE
MRLFLIRHGQTEWNNDSRAQGHTDVSLDEIGLRQSELLGRRFSFEDVQLVLSSDLRRSVQTAEPIARAAGAPLELDARLRERTFGDWEGHAYGIVSEGLHRLHNEAGVSLYDVRPPNGESMRDVWERLAPVVEMLRVEHRDVAVVSHGGATALLLAQIVGGAIEVSRAFRFANSGVTELMRRPDGSFYIARYNDIAHLEAEQVLSGDLDGTHR